MNNNTIDSVRIPREGNYINEGARAFAKNFYETVGGMGAWVLNQQDHPMPPVLHAHHEAMQSMENMMSACVMKSEEELQGGALEGVAPNELVLVRRQLMAVAEVEAEKAKAAGKDTVKWLDEWFAGNLVRFVTQLPQAQQMKMVSWWHRQPSSVKSPANLRVQQQAYMKAHGVAVDKGDQGANGTEANFYASPHTHSASHTDYETVHGLNNSVLKTILKQAIKEAAMEVLRTADHSGSVLHAVKMRDMKAKRVQSDTYEQLLELMREVANNTQATKQILEMMEGM